MKRAGLLIVALVAMSSAAHSDDSIGLIIYAEGTEISIYRGGRLETFRLNYDDVIGMPVYAGDMLQTGEGTFLEVQLAPAENVLKVAENTTFTLTRLAGGGNGSFDVSYGRVRAQVQTLARNERFEIRGRAAIAGVRGTDFGYDVVAERGGAIETKVYCFDGEVEVSVRQAPPATEEPSEGSGTAGPVEEQSDRTDTPGESPIQVVRVQANEMVALRTDPETQTESPAVRRTESVTPAIREYWTRNDFREEAVPAGRLLDEFPKLRQRVIDERGVDIQEIFAMPSSAAEEERDPSPPPDPEPSIARRVAEAPSDEEEEVQLSPEEFARRVAQRRQFNRTAGWLVTTAGVLVTGASFGIEYYGAEYLPDTTPETRESIRQGTLISGSILLSTGIASFIMSFF